MTSVAKTLFKDPCGGPVKALRLGRVPAAVEWPLKRPEGIRQPGLNPKACRFSDVAGLEGAGVVENPDVPPERRTGLATLLAEFAGQAHAATEAEIAFDSRPAQHPTTRIKQVTMT